jgi:hypothetical protein
LCIIKLILKALYLNYTTAQNMCTLEQNYNMMAQPSGQISQRHSLWRAGNRQYAVGSIKIFGIDKNGNNTELTPEGGLNFIAGSVGGGGWGVFPNSGANVKTTNKKPVNYEISSSILKVREFWSFIDKDNEHYQNDLKNGFKVNETEEYICDGKTYVRPVPGPNCWKVQIKENISRGGQCFHPCDYLAGTDGCIGLFIPSEAAIFYKIWTENKISPSNVKLTQFYENNCNLSTQIQPNADACK